MSTRLSCLTWSIRWRMPFCSQPLAVVGRRDARVEDEEVPGEAAAGAERRVGALEDAAAVGPGGQMAERADGDVDQSGGLLQLELAHVALAELDVDAGRGDPLARLREHRRRRVDAEHLPAGLASDRDRDAAVPDRELDERPVGLAGELDVEGDVLGHVRRPVVVDRREGVVGAHVALSLARDHARAAAVYAAPARRGGARVAAPPVPSRGASFPVPTTPGGGHGRQER